MSNMNIHDYIPQMYSLYMEGYSLGQIGRMYNYSDKSVWKYLRLHYEDIDRDILNLDHKTIDGLKHKHLEYLNSLSDKRVLYIPPAYIVEDAPSEVDKRAFRFFYAVDTGAIPLIYRFMWYGRVIDKPKTQAISKYYNGYYANMYYKRRKWTVNFSRVSEALFSEKLLGIDEIKRWFVNYWTYGKDNECE